MIESFRPQIDSFEDYLLNYKKPISEKSVSSSMEYPKLENFCDKYYSCFSRIDSTHEFFVTNIFLHTFQRIGIDNLW